jgi:DNA-binding FadR family transcriptional regulator
MASLVDKTLDRLLEIVIETGSGGTIPPQDKLATQLEVSRTVLREAISKLLMLGVITVRPKVGTTVNDTSKWKLVNDDVIAWRLRSGEAREVVLAELERAKV